MTGEYEVQCGQKTMVAQKYHLVVKISYSQKKISYSPKEISYSQKKSRTRKKTPRTWKKNLVLAKK